MSKSMLKLPAIAAAAVLAAVVGLEPALAGLGQPTPGQMGLQLPATEVADAIHKFHNMVNLIIIAIATFVLILLLYVMFRFNERRNPVPSTSTHNTILEVAWTVIPILILVAIAIPSFKLLFLQYSFPKPDLTIKATGNAWFWSHAYPDQGGFEIESAILADDEVAELQKKGVNAPRLLAVDNEVVVPVNKVVHVLVTSNDVIHNWTIPSFGSKIDAVPGRTTATWFRADKEGVFYGQCSELCGLDHARMPIAIRVVKENVFNAWAAAMQAKDKKKAKELIETSSAAQTRPAEVAAARTE